MRASDGELTVDLAVVISDLALRVEVLEGVICVPQDGDANVASTNEVTLRPDRERVEG